MRAAQQETYMILYSKLYRCCRCKKKRWGVFDMAVVALGKLHVGGIFSKSSDLSSSASLRGKQLSDLHLFMTESLQVAPYTKFMVSIETPIPPSPPWANHTCQFTAVANYK